MLEQLEFMVITCGQQQTWLSCVHASAVFVRRCFALWALNNVTKTGNKCLWQESVGGSAGYSTSCTGAATNALPAAAQVNTSCAWH